jgi:hypothetical protein
MTGTFLRCFILVLPLFLATPLYAVSYPISLEEPGHAVEEDALRTGSRVQLFHSGTEDVKSTIRVGDVLAVYRELPPGGPGTQSPSARVRITGVTGGYYFEGEVVEGHLYPGYLALKGTVACFVTGRSKAKH